MKFDLEINITDVFTQAGKDKLADIFFPTEIGTTSALFNNILLGSLSFVDLDRYRMVNNFNWYRNIDASNFRSHIGNIGDVPLTRILIKRGSIIPFFGTGTLVFHRYALDFSNNSTRLLFDYDADFDRYYAEIPDDIDLDTLTIITSRLSSGGLIDVGSEFMFIQESNVGVSTVDGTPPTIYKPNQVIISLDSTTPIGIYASIYNSGVIKICDADKIKTGDFDTVKSTMADGDFYVDVDNSLVIIKRNNKFYDYRHKLLFSKSKENYLYTISTVTTTEKRYIYLNVNALMYNQDIILSIPATSSRIIFYNEYPLINITTDFTLDLPQANAVRKLKNLIRFTNSTSSTVNINRTLSGQLFPTIKYRRLVTREERNVKHMKVDISPRSINFGDGVLCFVNAEMNKKSVPEIITIDHGDNALRPFSSKGIKVKVLNSDGAPLPNKRVKLTIIDNLNGMVEWGVPADDTNSVYGITDLSGEFETTLLNTNVKIGDYIQKEWIGDILSHSTSAFDIAPGTGNKLYIPSEINTTDVDKLYLFAITADDPLLGQIRDKGGIFGITSDYFTSVKPSDYYIKNNDITTYQLNGRKIAYVHVGANILSSGKYTVSSSFIKPNSVTIINASKEFYGRKLFAYDSGLLGSNVNKGDFDTILSNPVSANFSVIPDSEFTITSFVTSGFDSKWLLTDNYFTYFKFTVPKYTEVVYPVDLPGIFDDNVIGYFLRAVADNLITIITAEHSDEFLGITISTTSSDITLSALQQSEDSFTLSTDINNINSYIGPYSYLTLSDYLNSAYGTNFATYVCKYSSRVIDQTSQNRCMHPDQSNAQFYFGDDGNLYCGHNPIYDSTALSPCPGLDAQLMNPFLYYTD